MCRCSRARRWSAPSTLIATEADHRYSDSALSTARDLAAHAGLAIDNAQLYERAQQAIHAREDVLSFVSHDLRNPLMGIHLTTDTLLRSPPEGGERRKGWRQISGRSLQESATLAGRLATTGHPDMRRRFAEKAQAQMQNADVIRRILLAGGVLARTDVSHAGGE